MKTLLVLPPLSSCLIKLTLGVTHSMVHDNVWFRRLSVVLSHYVFYICFVFLVLTTSTIICELLYSNAMLLHAVVNCILLMSAF